MTALVPRVRTTTEPVISLVIPFYNERDVLPECVTRLGRVMDGTGLPFEAVFVDDGGRDGGAEWLMAQCRGREWIRVVRLSRNFGKEAALTAGLDHARGDAVVVLDADLQDPPECIPAMIERWRAGADMVLMQRRSRGGETWLKRTSAHLFYRLLRRLSRSDIPADTGDFRLMSRRAVDAVRRLDERNRYMKGLFAWVGLPTEVLRYDREARFAGRSKWGYWRLVGLALEGITSFSVAPLRWAAAIGAVAALLGGGYGLWIIAKALLLGVMVRGYPSLTALITFLGGLQLLTVGIVGEYVGKVYLETKQRPIYLVRDVVDRASLRRESAPSRAAALEVPRADAG
ncbi:glycosyltransferase family 2 protein [Alloalcanivorax profundimaris]|uniref:glycosyltransferase family 2 protein n=1 Tax=Alloalcanivorax profundimaris TaxID=2735259 RepID=UPI0018910A68|nr:glycosyltransferase family 2 protein [Alloalcanivorax profundimaris]